jgi:hypothetical protein
MIASRVVTPTRGDFFAKNFLQLVESCGALKARSIEVSDEMNKSIRKTKGRPQPERSGTGT